MPKIKRPSSVSPGSLVICSTCHRLRGAYPPINSKQFPPYEMLCGCATAVERKALVKEPMADFPTYAELCRCCGLVLLPSGSRWSMWFCPDCKPLVAALNRICGASVVPSGRHSVHRGLGAHPESRVPTLDLEKFRAGDDNWIGRIDGITDHAATVVARNLKSLGMSRRKQVYVGEYLAAIERSELSYIDAFMELAFGFALIRKGGQ